MQVNKIVLNEHYAARVFRFEVSICRCVAIRFEKAWNGRDNDVIMRVVDEETGAAIPSATREYSEYKVSVRDVLKPWDEYRKEREQRLAGARADRDAKLANQDALTAALLTLGFDKAQISYGYSQSREPVNVQASPELKHSKVQIRADALIALAEGRSAVTAGGPNGTSDVLASRTNNIRPPDQRCGSCGRRLVPQRGAYENEVYDPDKWATTYTHAEPMMECHGAFPAGEWDE